MILEIESEDRHVTVEVSASAGVRKVTMDGREVSYDWVRLPNGHYSLILDGRVFDFIIEISNGTCSVLGREGLRLLRVVDRRRALQQRDVEEGQAGLQKLTADMPGKVVRILVGKGDEVSYDQGLLVLEAMKMQNEIRAPKSGIVKEIGVQAGAAVTTGQFLLSLE